MPVCPFCRRELDYRGWTGAQTHSRWWCQVCEKTISIDPFQGVSREERAALVQDVSKVDSAERVGAAVTVEWMFTEYSTRGGKAVIALTAEQAARVKAVLGVPDLAVTARLETTDEQTQTVQGKSASPVDCSDQGHSAGERRQRESLSGRTAEHMEPLQAEATGRWTNEGWIPLAQLNEENCRLRNENAALRAAVGRATRRSNR